MLCQSCSQRSVNQSIDSSINQSINPSINEVQNPVLACQCFSDCMWNALFFSLSLYKELSLSLSLVVFHPSILWARSLPRTTRTMYMQQTCLKHAEFGSNRRLFRCASLIWHMYCGTCARILMYYSSHRPCSKLLVYSTEGTYLPYYRYCMQLLTVCVLF